MSCCKSRFCFCDGTQNKDIPMWKVKFDATEGVNCCGLLSLYAITYDYNNFSFRSRNTLQNSAQLVDIFRAWTTDFIISV